MLLTPSCWCGDVTDRERVHRAQACLPWVQRERPGCCIEDGRSPADHNLGDS